MASWATSKEYTFQFFLVMFAIALAVPLMASSIYLVARVAQSQRDRLENVAHGATSRAAFEINEYLSGKVTLMRALGSLQGDAGSAIPEIQRQSAIVFGAYGIKFEITNSSGKDILDIPHPGGKAAPQPNGPNFVDVEINESGADFVRLSVPLPSKDGAPYTLHAEIPATTLAAILSRSKPSGPYIGTLIGRNGLLLASTAAQEQMVGRMVNSIAEIRKEKGVVFGKKIVDDDVIAFWRTMPVTDWTVVLSIDKAAMTQPLYRNISVIAAGAVFMLALGLVLAAIASRQLRNSLLTLLGVARAVGQGQVVEEIGTPLREANLVGHVLASASRELNERARELRRNNEELEQKVDDRTADLLEKAELLDTTFQSLDQGIIHFDAAGVIRKVNGSAEALGIVSPIGIMLEPAMAPREGTPHLIEHRREDGTIIEIRTTLLQDGSAVCTYTDVTDRIRAAERLAEATHLAEKANEAKDAFFATMSHEIRTPLNGMLGYAELLLLDSTLSIRQRDYAMRINGAGAALYTVLGDLLDYARFDAESLHIKPKPFAFLELFSEAMSIVEPLALAKGLEFRTTMPTSFPHQLLGDKNRLCQVLLNLLNNAIKFTDKGHVWLNIEGADVADDRYSMVIRVEDTGTGIPLRDQPHIFERFFQVESARRRADSGVGLGLAISKQLVESMGGSIDCESNGFSGAVFKVILTLPKAGLIDAGRRPERTIPSAPSRRARILVAEDIEISRQLICEMLEALGHHVECVATGLEAVNAVRRERFDLVLMDIFMPDLDGIAAMRLIRGLCDPEGNVPILACTANASPGKVAEYESEGFDGCLVKPLRLSDLQSTVDEVLEQRSPACDEHERTGRERLQPESDGPTTFRKFLDPALVQRGVDEFGEELQALWDAEITSTEKAADIADRAHRLQSHAVIFGMAFLLEELRHLEMNRHDLPAARDALEALRPSIAMARHMLARI